MGHATKRQFAICELSFLFSNVKCIDFSIFEILCPKISGDLCPKMCPKSCKRRKN